MTSQIPMFFSKLFKRMLLGARISPGWPPGKRRGAQVRRPRLPFYVDSTPRGGCPLRQVLQIANTTGFGRLSPESDMLIGAAPAFGNYIMFAAAIPRRLWLAQIDLAEIPLNRALERFEARSLKDLDHEITVRLQMRGGEIERPFGESHASCLIDDIDAGQIGRHVG